MKNDIQEPTQEEVDRAYARLAKDAKQGGYNLNPDIDFVKGLINGLIVNESRYGYQACPCRLAADDKAEDMIKRQGGDNHFLAFTQHIFDVWTTV